MVSPASSGDMTAGEGGTVSLPGVALPTTPVGDVFWEGLRDGSVLASLRAAAPATMKLRSDAELDASLQGLLADWDGVSDVHVFAYGSLMWNPAFRFVESSAATLRGWARKFCIRLDMGRGTVDRPGLMLALDLHEGAVCQGVALRIEAAHVREELAVLWRREMLAGSYTAAWVELEVTDQAAIAMRPGEGGAASSSAQPATRHVPALTFVVNRASSHYLSDLTDERAAELITSGQGLLGSCASYFQTTLETLRRLRIDDPDVERLGRAVGRRLATMREEGMAT